MRVIVCGSRKWKDADAIRQRLEQLPPGTLIVHGDCLTGADKIADDVSIALKVGAPGTARNVERHPALWSRYGRKAGPLRNQRMADLGADLCIAFADKMSGGTWDMVTRARKAEIPVEIVWAK